MGPAMGHVGSAAPASGVAPIAVAPDNMRPPQTAASQILPVEAQRAEEMDKKKAYGAELRRQMESQTS